MNMNMTEDEEFLVKNGNVMMQFNGIKDKYIDRER